MASDHEGRRKSGKAGQIAMYGLMAMLIFGLGGFGITSFGGGTVAIGKVGDREITVDDYARSLQQEINAFGAQFGQQLSFAQAQALGIDRSVQAAVVTRAALDNEAARVGISVGDETVAAEVTSTQAFQGVSGNFDRETYRMQLERLNFSETEFEADLRRDVARQLLQGAVAGGFAAPPALTDTLYAWSAERRGFSLLRLTEAALTAPLPSATDADLAAFHTANIDRYTRPEAKRLSYVALLPETLAAASPASEDDIKAAYEARKDEYIIPEKRLVERLVFPDEAAAAEAKAKLDAGETFESLVEARGLTLADIDMGDVAREDLGAAADGVFALTEPGVVGPLPSDLGPALYRMNAILAAQETTLDEVRDTLATEIALQDAARAIADKVEAVDDLLAGGASFDDLVREQGMEKGTLDYAPTAEGLPGFAADPAFRAAAEAVAEGDFPEALLLDDGALVAIQFVETVPATPIPLEEVKDRVAADWRADALQKALSARAVEIKAAVEGGTRLETLGIVSRTAAIPRDGTVENAPSDLLAQVFRMAEGDLAVVEGAGFTGVVQLDAIIPAASEGADAEALKTAISVQAEQALAQDAFLLFGAALQAEAGISLDQQAINAVHAQFP